MNRNDIVRYMTQVYEETHRGGNSEMSDEERMDYLLTHIESLIRYEDGTFSWPSGERKKHNSFSPL